MTSEEITVIENNVYLYSESILLVKDDGFDDEQSKIMMQKVIAMLEEHKPPFIILDLTTGKRPSAIKAEIIKTSFKSINSNCRHMAVFTGKNLLVNVAIQFVLGNLGIPKSVNKNIEEALRKINSL